MIESTPWFSDPQWLDTIVRSAPDGLLVESGEQIVYINNTYAHFLGVRQQDLIGKPVGVIVADEDRTRLRDYGRARLNNHAAPALYEFVAHSEQGNVRLSASVKALSYRNKPFIVTTVRQLETPRASSIDAAKLLLSQGLAPREIEVARLLLQGLRMKEIACQLGMSPKTASTHRARIFRKLQLTDVSQLFRFAVERGLVDWTSPRVEREGAPLPPASAI